MIYFDHPYPRFGLAYTLFSQKIRGGLKDVLSDKGCLAKLAAETIDDELNYVRLHTEDSTDGEGERQLRFRYLARDELKTSGQTSAKLYYMAPHVATDDTGTNRLVKAARKIRDQLLEGKGLHKSTQLKRSFSPFTSKINEGKKSLSNPRVTRLQAAFTLIATLARYKPAKQVDFSNQVIIPDLDLEDMIDFIDLFQQMKGRETGEMLTTRLRGESKRYRPPIFDGNYPDAPRGSAFGPVGLMGAMGKWVQRAEDVPWAEAVLKKIPERPLYLVSYEQKLMQQVHLGHHVATLALQHDLPKALAGLHRSKLYKTEDNERTNTGDYKPNRKLFHMMAGRFLQLYTRPAFRDFLSFRVQYEPSFSSILEDYFMNQRQLSEDLVRSARAYGKYLNRQAWEAGLREEKTKNTNRTAQEAKTNVLNQMESTVMSSKRASEIFARLNRDARQIDNWDAPSEAERFVEAAIVGKEIDLETTKELIRAFMRLSTQESSGSDSAKEDEAEEVFVSGE